MTDPETSSASAPATDAGPGSTATESPAALARRARQLFNAGKSAEARAAAEAALAADPGHGDARETLGAIAFHAGEPERAWTLLNDALAKGHDTPGLRTNLGVMRSQAGEFAAAEAECLRALELDPMWVDAFHLLAHFHKFQADEPVVAQLEAALARPLDSRRRGLLCFAAGKMYADLGRHDDAFRHYQEGNRRLRQPYDRRPLQRLTARARAMIDRDFFAARRGFGLPGVQPVFVVGLPSSGSTLVEQILTRHPEVESLGEFGAMPQIVRQHLPEAAGSRKPYPDNLADLTAGTAAALARGYLEAANRKLGRDPRGPAPTRLLDKAPVNWQHLPLIALLFPDARIVHTARNPMDVGVSVYFRRFLWGQAFSYDLADIGFTIRREQALMRHWGASVPLPILNLGYESLVANPESVARLLVAAAGLEWTDACLDPETDGSARIYNASQYAARQPIHRGSAGKWKRYAAHLDTLKRALQEDLPPADADT
jgi:tetratricopeptide (TPR) repeat protein